MIDFYAVKDGISLIGGFLVGEDDLVEVVEIGGEKRDKRQNSCDRNVSVVSLSAFIHFEKFGVKCSGVDHSRSIDFTR
jgi:hypothetical protein